MDPPEPARVVSSCYAGCVRRPVLVGALFRHEVVPVRAPAFVWHFGAAPGRAARVGAPEQADAKAGQFLRNVSRNF